MSKEIQCKCCKEYWWERNIHSKSGLCPNCYDYVSDLEAKLAEKDAERELDNSFWKQECDSLQKTLVEKDKEIAKYRNANMIVMGRRSQGKKHLMEIKIKELQNQKALEQLEKVKENIKKVPITDFDLSGNFEKMYKQDAIRQIDNQIEELKKEIK